MTTELEPKKETRWDLKRQVRELEKQVEILQKRSMQVQNAKTSITVMHNCSHCRGHKT